MYLDPNIKAVLLEGLRREGWPKPARVAHADKGGLTRGGITALNWGVWRNLGEAATKEQLDAITEDEALEFYHEEYVRRPGFESVTDQRLRALLIDWSFTSWFDDPVEALQTSLKARGLYDGKVDGDFGPKTKHALLFTDRDPRQTYRDVFNARITFYRDLAFDHDVHAFLKSHPESQLHNLAGWTNRCLEFTP